MVFALGAVLGLTMVGFAGGSAGFEGLLEACGVATLPAPKATMAEVEMAEPDIGTDLLLVPVPGLPLDGEVDTHTCSNGAIRPGVQQSNGCTLSWIFRDQNGAYYQTTAGHCTSRVGQVIGATGVGPIGTVVFRINAGVGNDIALIRIDPALYSRINPTLCHWGGPTGIATPADTLVAGSEAMLHYGYGVAYSFSGVSRARAGVVHPASWDAGGSVQMVGITDGGDSGSPMMLSSGLAAGVHTHRLHPGGFGLPPGPKAATRLDMWIPRIESNLGIDLDIATGQPVDLTGLSISD